jgi:hypothetical protein
MTTRYYQTAFPLVPEHFSAFEEHHRMRYPGNALAVIPNLAGTECLVKCDDSAVLPHGFMYTAELTHAGALALLETAEWR